MPAAAAAASVANALGYTVAWLRRSTTSLGTCSSQSETLRGFSHELNPNALRDDRCVDGLVKNVCVSFQTPPTSGPTETALRV